jgi:Flp pilus assembly secretin CpaC
MKPFVRSTLVALTLLSVPALADPPKKPAPEAKEEVITVRVGNAKAMRVPGMTRLALGDPEIADVNTSGDEGVRIDGLKAGETTLLIWTGKSRKSYRIVVEP